MHAVHGYRISSMTASTAPGTRTTVRLSPEVLAAARKLQEEKGLSLSDAVDELCKAGLERTHERRPFVLRTFSRREPKFDLINVAEVLEIIDGDGVEGYR